MLEMLNNIFSLCENYKNFEQINCRASGHFKFLVKSNFRDFS